MTAAPHLRVTAAPHLRVIVALDTQLAVGTATGIGVYQRDLAPALRAAGTDVRALSAPWLDPWRFDRRVLWDQVLLPAAAARSGAAVLHASAGTMPFVRTRCPPSSPSTIWPGTASRAIRAATRAGISARCKRASTAAPPRSSATPPSARASTASWPAIPRRTSTSSTPASTPASRNHRAPRRRLPLRARGGHRRSAQEPGGADRSAAGAPGVARHLGRSGDAVRRRGPRARSAASAWQTRVDCCAATSRAKRSTISTRAQPARSSPRATKVSATPSPRRCAPASRSLAARSSSLVEVAGDDIALIDPDDVAAWTEAIRKLLADRDAAQRRADALRPRRGPSASAGPPPAASQMQAIYERVAAPRSVDRGPRCPGRNAAVVLRERQA